MNFENRIARKAAADKEPPMKKKDRKRLKKLMFEAIDAALHNCNGLNGADLHGIARTARILKKL